MDDEMDFTSPDWTPEDEARAREEAKLRRIRQFYEEQAIAPGRWLAEIDALGPFAALDQLWECLCRAPEEIKMTCTYAWLEGMYYGRAVHEEFGGLPGHK